MDSFGPYRTDLVDVRDHKQLFTLSSSCIALYQPTKLGMISMTNVHYRSLLSSKIVKNSETRQEQRDAPSPFLRVVRGLAGTYEPYLLCIATLPDLAWQKMTDMPKSKCWLRPRTLPTSLVSELKA